MVAKIGEVRKALVAVGAALAAVAASGLLSDGASDILRVAVTAVGAVVAGLAVWAVPNAPAASDGL